MECLSVRLTDLPDEILMISLKKLDNITLLYSLSGVNRNLNKLAYDFMFTSRLTLLYYLPICLIKLTSLSINYFFPLSDLILNRFCLHILPKIHQKVKWLDLELLSMERILRTAYYPNLSGIGLYNMDIERVKNQISSLIIDINTNGEQSLTGNENTLLFTRIFTTFTNLRLLNIGPSSICYQHLSFDLSPPTVISSTLLELHVCLSEFHDCLHLLDGRFNQLRIFHVKIDFIELSSLIFNNKEKLSNLRSFTLFCDNTTDGYYQLILPLLHRMSNLEELDLSLLVWMNNTFIDDNLPSNEYIQETLKNFENKKIITSMDYFHENKYSQCHIYSYPYKLKNYYNITNNFRVGIFNSVRRVSLFDERSFEHEFFLRITQSFPFMEKLTLINNKRQNNKQFRKSKKINQDSPIIKYPYLIERDLSKAQKDYYGQFLFDTKTCLPNNIRVNMDYRLVKKVTRNFRRPTTRINCAKIVFVYFLNKSKFPEYLKDFFPRALIC
ncbi:unnamed protein product [Rotaria magnacalcarata]|uniref:F-box domain-containing protein n=2 Tax=Rotaria magnacalcarata TaxID=392030 RepID=A0A820F491_9BILA|nr:unnamed protein product [Rotaria magnacalcarata]CAF4255490.1 unnamed protein product [Rotaria magnacalcarata]